MNNLLKINPSAETRKITSFIKNILAKERFKKVVIGLSGGIDSAVSFYLLKEAISSQNIIVAHLYYFESQIKEIEPMLKQVMIPKENVYEMSIAPIVKSFQQAYPSSERSESRNNNEAMQQWNNDRMRLGNIMARTRMIVLYDLAKKHNAMVCGTENRSEHLLGYFTRFGDAASDFEPIQHLYKTQVYELAEYLGVPRNIIEKEPSADLWQNQTDEGEFGFSYKEADQVLFYYYDKKLKLEEIKRKGFVNAEKIIDRVNSNAFKHNLPYKINEQIPNTKLQIPNKLK